MNIGILSAMAIENSINNSKTLGSSLEKLSTGLKINKASDDASGLAIADKLRTQASSIGQGIDNGNSAISLLQIADKSMSEQSNILDTVKAKLIQANTDTTSAEGRESIRKDIVKLLEQLDNIGLQTNYNGTTLLQASSSDTESMDGLDFQVGENSSDIISTGAIQSNTYGLNDNLSGQLISQTLTGPYQSYSNLVSGATNYNITFTSSNYYESNITMEGIGGIISHADTGVYALAVVAPLASDTYAYLQGLSNTNSNIVETSHMFYFYNGENVDFGNTSFEIISMYSGDSTIPYSYSGGEVTSIGTHNYASGDLTISGNYSSGESLIDLKSLGTNALTKQESGNYQSVVDDAITKLNEYRSEIGSTQNQIESAVRNLMTQETNVKAAESIIRDVDYATESANFNKANIVSQAGSYALSQANKIEEQYITQLLQ